MKAAKFHFDAETELLEAGMFYEKQRQGLGTELIDEVHLTVSKIQGNPSLHPRFRQTRFRFCTVNRFPYVVYFQEFDDYIWIVAVSHGRRRPGYWSRRKPE